MFVHRKMYIQQGIDTSPTSASLTDKLIMSVLVTVLNFRFITNEVRISPFPVMIVTIKMQYIAVTMKSSVGGCINVHPISFELLLTVLFWASMVQVRLTFLILFFPLPFFFPKMNLKEDIKKKT